MTTEAEAPQPKKQALTWSEVAASGTGQGRIPRVRMFMFSVSREITVVRDKYGPGKDQYCFPIEEGEDGPNVVGSNITTASRPLIRQIQTELKEYLPTQLFQRTYILAREGEGMKTTYILKGYEHVADAKVSYASILSYLREVGE